MDLSLLRRTWTTLKGLPGGGKAMGLLAGRLAPYTGTIRPEVMALERGHARLRMEDRRGLRNHLRSVHAVALANLAEATSGLGMVYSLPHGARGIVTSLSMQYLKKARGPITSQCHFEPPTTAERAELDLHVELTDGGGELVARATVHWLVGPAPGSGA